MKIQIVGPGCPRCRTTEKNATNACAELKLNADISHIYDAKEYSRLGVKITPAVVVDGKILVAGKVPTVTELKKLFSEIKKPEFKRCQAEISEPDEEEFEEEKELEEEE